MLDRLIDKFQSGLGLVMFQERTGVTPNRSVSGGGVGFQVRLGRLGRFLANRKRRFVPVGQVIQLGGREL